MKLFFQRAAKVCDQVAVLHNSSCVFDERIQQLNVKRDDMAVLYNKTDDEDTCDPPGTWKTTVSWYLIFEKASYCSQTTAPTTTSSTSITVSNLIILKNNYFYPHFLPAIDMRKQWPL